MLELIGMFICSYILFEIIINLCTMRKLKKLDGIEKANFIKKRRLITIIVAIAFIIFSIIMNNIASVM